MGPVLCLIAAALALAPAPARAQVTFGSPAYVITAYAYKNISTDATTVVKAAPGVLHTLCVNTPAATEVITIYDNASVASGTKIATLTLFASTNPCFTFDVNFALGLTIVTATAAGDITVSYL